MSTDPLLAEARASKFAQHLYEAFLSYNEDFREITRRARVNFEDRDWHNAHRDAVERIELYDRWVDRVLGELEKSLGESVRDVMLWKRIKALYERIIDRDLDKEFTKTFFSSITRRLFSTEGVNPSIEFVAIDARPVEGISDQIDCHVYTSRSSLASAVSGLLGAYVFSAPHEDLQGDVDYVCREIKAQLRSACGEGATVHWRRIETIKEVFFQGTRAYIVGRMITDSGTLPLIIALTHKEGIRVDAAILDEDEASILFSFARSYFHVDLDTVIDVVAFLRTIMPRKPVSELYTMLGRAKQGKTERYRSFFHHLANSDDLFVAAAGQKGMVMLVFTLPSYDIVFKVIRDRFAYPKDMSRQDVVDRYKLVSRHDRAGRLIDAQEFKKLRFQRDRFEPALLEELLTAAQESCHVVGDDVVIDHCYIERRMTPLDIYLREHGSDMARPAIIDYGQAIKDLARSNIFPGDLLLKNFGVSRHGRVIFYDYDELCLLEDCSFRDLPPARTPEEEMEAGAWFYVAEDDVFPEQFGEFLGLQAGLLEIFKEHHHELLESAFWRQTQDEIAAGRVLEVLPYRPRA